MARVYIDKSGQEWIFDYAEDRVLSDILCKFNFIQLPAGSVCKLLGRKPRIGQIYKLRNNDNTKKI